MKEEIQEAIEFLVKNLFKTNLNSFNENEISELRANLSQILHERYQGHWYDDKPYKGQGYRSVRFRRNDKDLDPALVELFKRCSNILDLNKFKFPLNDFTLWVDPGEVSCR